MPAPTTPRSALRRRLPQPTYANVMATVAVVLSMTMGTAYAAGLANNSVKSRHIGTNAIKERHIFDGSVRDGDIGTDQVGSRSVADGSLGAGDLGPDSVGKSELKSDTVDSGGIQDGQVKRDDVADEAISSNQLSVGVNRLLFNSGALAVNKTFADVSVSNDNWPGGAPDSGAQIAHTWTQPGGTLDVVTAIARVEFPASCSATASTARGFDVKITDGSDRVISASSPNRTDGDNYNGNGFWNQQEDLPGVSFRAPNGSDLADSPAAFIDYIHLPIEMAELVAGDSSVTRTVRVFFKRNSSNCTPVVTDTRLIVYRYA